MDWEKNIGIPLLHFIKDKYGSQKECCRRLRISQTMLSMAIRGKRKLPPIDQHKLEAAGFDRTIFYNYIDVLPNDDYVAVDDIRYVIGQLKDIIKTKDMLLSAAEMLNSNLQVDLGDAKRKITQLKKQIYNNSI